MIQKLKIRFLRWRATRMLKAKYEYINVVNEVMEEYLTEKLLQGGSQEFMAKGRADLAAKQQETQTNNEFLEFLGKL
jgi:hypothetical protein